ncbi:MAG: ATP-binding protein [Coriobacteriia bacterium]|nr:ATP-binding protein [Coriobacteriia bacterium]
MYRTRKIFLLAIGLVSLLLAGALTLFASQNSARVTEHTRVYLSDNTEKSADQLDRDLSIGYSNIKTAATLVSHSLTGPEFDVADLRDLVDDSVFDFMEFADADGMDHNITGGVSDARDRKYYLDAKAGNTGMELIYNSRATHETLLMFYSPIYYQDQFVGSLVGVYQASNRITHLLTDKFFGYPATSYLATGEGRVIACSDSYDPNQEIYLTDLSQGDESIATDIMEAMGSEGATAVPFPGSAVGGCLVKLPESGFYLLRVFPQEASDGILHRSNALVFQLTAVLVVVFVLFFLFLIRFFRDEQRQIQEAKEAAETANAAKTAFLFNMSHDIRTPMNAITGFTELLKKSLDDPERAAGYLQKIETSCGYLMSLINNVLQMARIDSGKMSLNEVPVVVPEFCNDLFSLFEAQAVEKNLTISARVDVEHNAVMVDETKLREVLLNLLSNAVKYTPENGTVTVTTTELPCDEPGRAIMQTVVTDTGIGMAPEFLPEIFEEFTRERTSTESKVVGTGLGMPIVKKLVDMMGGTVQVESELGKGTTFTLTLTHDIADDSQAKALSEAPDDIDPSLFLGKKILLAEDNELNAEIAVTLLSGSGFQITHVENGLACVEAVRESQPGDYDLILMDIQMPHLDGYGAARRIRALEDPQKASIPIIAMTANAFEEDRSNALACGMNDHVAKPIEVQKLVEALASVLEHRA